jgi:NTE family protein
VSVAVSTRGGRPTRAAVVCGGGGLTGGVFEVGALRALDTALGGGVLSDLDIYAGTSSGSLVATMLAAGLTPQDMDDVIIRGARNRRRLPPLSRSALFRLDLAAWAAAAGRVPFRTLRGLAEGLVSSGESSRITDVLSDLLSCLPSGLLTNEPMEGYVDEVLRQLGVPADVGSFPRKLLITALNMDNGHRVVFGQTGVGDVSVSQAVRASTALPLLFRPVRIDGQDFIGGGLERNVPVGVAVEAGAELVIAVNPLVPLVHDPRSDARLPRGHRYLSQGGMPAVFDQVFRTLVRSLTVYELKAVRDRFPEVDVVMIEPEANDWTMFSYNAMRYSVRERLAGHAFDTTRDRLVRDSADLTRLFDKHGLDFDVSRLVPARRDEGSKSRLGTILGWMERLPGLRGLAEEGEASDPF